MKCVCVCVMISSSSNAMQLDKKEYR
jgi:hypothetical protein